MILDSLSIHRRNSWEPGTGSYRGQIKFTNSSGAVELNLSDDVSRKLLAVIADSAVDAAKNIAMNLTADVFTNNALESK